MNGPEVVTISDNYCSTQLSPSLTPILGTLIVTEGHLLSWLEWHPATSRWALPWRMSESWWPRGCPCRRDHRRRCTRPRCETHERNRRRRTKERERIRGGTIPQNQELWIVIPTACWWNEELGIGKRFLLRFPWIKFRFQFLLNVQRNRNRESLKSELFHF